MIETDLEKELETEESVTSDLTEDVDKEISAKEQIYQLIEAVKDSIAQEVNYFKARTGYSIQMLLRSAIAMLLALLFVMVALISLGVGLLFILKPFVGIAIATLLTVVIFVTLSVVMVLIGRFYIKKLSFPELKQDDNFIEE